MSPAPALRLWTRADAGCLLLRWTGRFGAAAFLRHWRSLAEGGALDGGGAILCDMRPVWMDVPAAEIRLLSGTALPAGAWPGRRQMAVVADSDLAFGMHRMVASHLEGPRLAIAVFRDVAAAGAWLGLPARPGDPFAGMPPAAAAPGLSA